MPFYDHYGTCCQQHSLEEQCGGKKVEHLGNSLVPSGKMQHFAGKPGCTSATLQNMPGAELAAACRLTYYSCLQGPFNLLQKFHKEWLTIGDCCKNVEVFEGFFEVTHLFELSIKKHLNDIWKRHHTFYFEFLSKLNAIADFQIILSLTKIWIFLR